MENPSEVKSSYYIVCPSMLKVEWKKQLKCIQTGVFLLLSTIPLSLIFNSVGYYQNIN